MTIQQSLCRTCCKRIIKVFALQIQILYTSTAAEHKAYKPLVVPSIRYLRACLLCFALSMINQPSGKFSIVQNIMALQT